MVGSVDIFVFAILGLVMLVIIFLYLMVRKTLLSFREGYQGNRR